jgi:hypothetical protein
MPDKRMPKRSFIRLRGCMALVSVLAAAGLSVAAAGPATAQNNPVFDVYLANATTYGPYVNGGATCGGCYVELRRAGTVPGSGPQPGLWNIVSMGNWSADGISGPSWEFEAETAGGQPTGGCMGTTTLTGWVTNLPCGVNGTVWVEVDNGGGVFLYNRFFLNQGRQQVMVTAGPGSADPLFITPPQNIGAYWGRWGWTLCDDSCLSN